ncbi:DUF1684 domain-containing protein [Dokdonia sinensis]|uniref:DUF1684 domain-containing protein n=1 Tax=Dokdonia sinensis TaxID=2479847 RepID=A0A3M0GHV6_9FLAO|nr:DUF1684 domain-containing protein [Dokdonia sinensis]RMB63858.1 DUF1684 domain-containing protein [Dokdonia sinensis]
MKSIIYVYLVLVTASVFGQSPAGFIEEAKTFQEELNATYMNPDSTILSKRQLKKFSGLKFYPIDLKFRVSATFKRTQNAIPFQMELSSGRTREYVQYGLLTFELEEQQFELPIYQNTYYRDHPEEEYGNSLFLPFTDYTSGDGSYGGGRYIDFVIEDIEDNHLLIDFNRAYNPYCAYTTGYNCPIPPEANDLKFRIEAGVKDFDGKY